MTWNIFLKPLQYGVEGGAFHSASPETKKAILILAKKRERIDGWLYELKILDMIRTSAELCFPACTL